MAYIYENKLIVEGSEDLYAIAELMKHHVTWPDKQTDTEKWPVHIVLGKSADEILNQQYLALNVKEPGLKALGVMLDADNAGLDAHAALAAIRALLASLSPQDRTKVVRELAESVRDLPAPQAGKVLGVVVSMLPQQERWTTDEIKQKVAESGVAATTKEIYNAIGYCTRRQYLHHSGYGQYRVDGTPEICGS